MEAKSTGKAVLKFIGGVLTISLAIVVARLVMKVGDKWAKQVRTSMNAKTDTASPDDVAQVRSDEASAQDQ